MLKLLSPLTGKYFITATKTRLIKDATLSLGGRVVSSFFFSFAKVFTGCPVPWMLKKIGK